MALLVWTTFFLSGISNVTHYSLGTLLRLFQCSSPIAKNSAHVTQISWFLWMPLKAGLPYFSNVIPIIRASFGMISGSRFGSTHFVVEPTTPGIHFFSSYDSSYYVLKWCNLARISRAFRHRGFASSLLVDSNEICPRFREGPWFWWMHLKPG